MTRINCVPPSELSGKHLVAEYRELPRVFSLASRAFLARRKISAPARYTLGPGHVLFFYDKLSFCRSRFRALLEEMRKRGYKPQYASPPGVDIPDPSWWGEWTPTEEDLELNRKRILERQNDHR
jgi:deoxyribonuclease (pyrimidine dimer)